MTKVLARLLTVLAIPVRIIVFVILALDEIVGPLYRPVARWFATLGLIRTMETAVSRLNRWVILFLLLAPLAIAEPLKVYGVVLLGQGRLIRGALVLAVAYLLSLALIDRIYHAGRDKLLTIGPFAWLIGWIGALRDTLLTWVRSSGAWALLRRTRTAALAFVSRLIGRA